VSESLIRVESVSFAYPGTGADSTRFALRDVSLDIQAGQLVALIGQNGSGKTTLAKHLNGLLKPARGRVLVDGRDTRDVVAGELASVVGYVFQNPDHQIFSPTVSDEIAFGPRNLGLRGDDLERRVADALARFGLSELAGQHPTLLGRGLRRRVALASVYALRPRLLVLDEPTGGLDRRHALDLLSLLHELAAEARAIVLISHDMRLVGEFAERVVVMRHGTVIADGPVRELLPDDALLRSTGLAPPEVSMLAADLAGRGMPPAVDNQQFIDAFRDLLDRARGDRTDDGGAS
jgi:energy-coupling factor transporter ATP-binding protein EcfA2